MSLEDILQVISLVLGVAVFLLLRWAWLRWRKKKRASVNVQIWGYLPISAVAIAALLGSYLLFASLFLPATIYFDNGHANLFQILIDGENKGSVQPRSLELLEVNMGNHKIELMENGELFESISVSCRGGENYIYNIGGKYTYSVVTHYYAPTGLTAPNPGRERLIGGNVFFRMPAVDFPLGVEVPTELTVKGATRLLTKTSVQRDIQ